MTEEQWNGCTDPGTMLEFIGGRATDRKLRLFAVACCRRVWHLMTDPRHRRVTEAAERLADRHLGEAEFEEVLEPVVALWAELPNAREARWEPWHYMTGAARHLGTGGGARYAASYAARGLACLAGEEGGPAWLAARRAEKIAQSDLVRDLFGDPMFLLPMPRKLDLRREWLAWNNGTIPRLGQAIYEEEAFDRLPILADALEEAGCTDTELLGHLRGPGPHARGCFVLDLILGRGVSRDGSGVDGLHRPGPHAEVVSRH